MTTNKTYNPYRIIIDGVSDDVRRMTLEELNNALNYLTNARAHIQGQLNSRKHERNAESNRWRRKAIHSRRMFGQQISVIQNQIGILNRRARTTVEARFMQAALENLPQQVIDALMQEAEV